MAIKNVAFARESMLRRLYTINFIDAFIAGVTTVLIPLLMLERGIDVVTIGLVFAAAPLAKIVIRLAGAAIADSLGDRIIYVASSVSDFLLSITYLVSSTATGFAAGKLLDGARESLIWSAIRPSLMAAAPEKRHFILADLLSGRLVYNAFGSLAVGILFVFGGYDLPLLAIAVLSIYAVFSSLRMKNIHKAETHVRASDFSPFGRSQRFYETAGAFTIGSILYVVSVYMVLPLYFYMKGFSLGEIGLFYAGYYLINGSVLHIISRHKVGTMIAAVAGTATYCLGLSGVVLAPHALIPVFFLIMASGDAGLAILWEEINYSVTKSSRKRATDLAVILIPSQIGVMIASGAAGIAIATIGFAPIFALLALSEIIFSAWCVRLSRMKG